MKSVAKDTVLGVLIGLGAGSASAFFLVTLDFVTHVRIENRWLLALLPLAGFTIGFLYQKLGGDSSRGTHLILEEIHESRRTIPGRLGPLVLISTLITHLFGGSAGREGVAVQMGGALADDIHRRFGGTRDVLLISGLAAGFASVFGTPLAGWIFGLEVATFSRRRLKAVLPAAVSAFAGHWTALAWSVHHTSYPKIVAGDLGLRGVLCILFAGLIFGGVARAFAFAIHRTGGLFSRLSSSEAIRAGLGGGFVGGMILYWSLDRYSGLGLPVILQSLEVRASLVDPAWKFVLTSLTLGSGLKGGEVTPLFFIGASLGSWLAPLLSLPVGLTAALGFCAVFGGAANTPLAATLMGMEIFGSELTPFLLLACVASYVISGRTGIYRGQRLNFQFLKFNDLPRRRSSRFD